MVKQVAVSSKETNFGYRKRQNRWRCNFGTTPLTNIRDYRPVSCNSDLLHLNLLLVISFA
jgi:hypothetical protein